MKKQPMVILTGPTSVGKTALSLALAKKINGAIISADSMQVYKHMDIGSAKIMPQEMAGIRHYLIDELEPFEEFHVVRFVELAKKYLREIYDDGKIPMIVGGTGFYIQALLYDIDFTSQACDEEYRVRLSEIGDERGTPYLHQLLKEVDPKSAKEIHPNNKKRIIRALEFYHLSGTRISEHNETQRQKASPYDFAYFVLTDEREKLYANIDRRVDEMLARGLLGEVKSLKEMGCSREMVSMQGLGYKELLDYLDEKRTLAEAVCAIKQETRHFAKRQLTWFRREREVIWLDKKEYQYNDEKILEKMLKVLGEKGIIEDGAATDGTI